MTIFRINVYEVAELESRIIPGCHPSRLEAGMEEWFEKKTAEGGIVNANTDNDLEFTMIRLLVKRGMLDNRSISFRYHRANFTRMQLRRWILLPASHFSPNLPGVRSWSSSSERPVYFHYMFFLILPVNRPCKTFRRRQLRWGNIGPTIR